MNIRQLKHFGLLAALAGSLLAASVASASIVTGSKVQISGVALIDALGNVTPLDEGTGLSAPSPVRVLVNTGGNTLSFAGYNTPNPGALLFAPNYATLTNPIPGAGPFGFMLLELPAVTIGAGEPGPAVEATRFVLNSWTFQTLGPFFIGTGLGVLTDVLGNFLGDGEFLLSSQSFTPGSVNSFSGTLEITQATTVIPVPGALWIFGSGLLLMFGVMRRKSS